MIKRERYIDRIRPFFNNELVKVLTGIRRAGKSVMLDLIREELLKEGVLPTQCIMFNFESMNTSEFRTAHSLYQEIARRITSIEGKSYLFFDEIQEVEGWEQCINSCRVDFDCDIYITGSNAYILSGELATLLSGRYVEINMLPLSFAEYRSVKTDGSDDTIFAEYLRLGGLPYIVSIDDANEKADAYLEGIYNTVIIKDIEERQKRKDRDGKRNINDIALLKNIARFLASSVGNPVSIKSIADYITSSGRKVSQNTVSEYVSALVEPYIFYPVERYDVEGKQLLKQNQKYYISDLGLRRYMVTKKNYDLGFSLENVVYLELKRRGYRINIGKVGSTEVDFVTEKNGNVTYVQVTASMTDEKTFEREMAPLKTIKDNHPKMILTLDRFTAGNYDGITVENVIDWLLEGV